MKKRISLSESFFATFKFIGCGSLISLGVWAGTLQPKVIYGNDDRLDLYQVNDPKIVAVANSTAAMIPKAAFSDAGTTLKINAKTFGDDYGLCQSEPFFHQPNGAMCSAFLVGPDLLATAGHCVSEFDCGSNAFVFDYKMDGPNQAPLSVSKNNVYYCTKVIAREQTRQQDYALIQLDRPVAGRKPLALSKSRPKAGDALILVGHPSGLPTKVAAGASVRKLDTGFFVANTDSYGGNSGSAVFNAKTLEVVGILVRGEEDFAYDSVGQCTKSNVCTDTGCRGEDSTLIEYIIKNL